MEGPNKLLLKFNTSTIVEQAYNALSKSAVYEIIVVTGRDAEAVSELLSIRNQDSIVHNPDFRLGLTTSIQKGVVKADSDAFMLCLADMPLLCADHYDLLLAEFKSSFVADPWAILAPLVNGKRGNPVIFSKAHKPAILAHTEMNGCRSLINHNLNHFIRYNTEDHAFLSDIDTAEDYSLLNQ